MSLLTPVRYAVKYYKWDDDQAPQLTDADGVIKTILKACLVTGYGDKAGAGWAARFEDDSRIVLRRPLQIGNPPDIKIENGVVNGKASHRIVLQNNPSGLDDANELVTTFMNARDNRCGQEWHLIATDFAFILCYQMLQYSPKNEKNYAMFIGSMQGVSKSAPLGFYMFADAEIQQNGTPRNYTECIIPAGITQLSNSGIHEQVSIVMRWADKYNLKLANLGDIWQINDKTADGTDDAWRAIVQSVALDVKVDDGVPVIWQMVGLDRYLDT